MFRPSVCKSCHNEWRKQKYLEHKNKDLSDVKIKCNTCNEEKSGNEFKYGQNSCKKCLGTVRSRCKPTDDMPDKHCIDCSNLKKATAFRAQTNICIECEKQRLYAWRKDNPDKFKEHTARYRAKPDYREKENKLKRFRYHNDINEKNSRLYRKKVRQHIYDHKAGETLSDQIDDLIGCSPKFFIEWLIKNMYPDMTFDNYGIIWNLDHVTPCNYYDLSNPDEINKCFHWSNTIPTLSVENQSKFNKLDRDKIVVVRKKVILELNNLINSLLNEVQEVLSPKVNCVNNNWPERKTRGIGIILEMLQWAIRNQGSVL